MLSDAHCHLEGNQELATLQQENDVLTIINCDSPEEWHKNQQLAVGRHQYLSFGLHPWKTEDYTFEEIYPYLQQAAIIGEIGLDRVWTNIPLAHQVKLFRKQLAYAALTDKPVVLHTKGCEREILTFIKEYPNRYLVHWYSSLELQKEYIEAGCYFTIGVDLKINQAVQRLAKGVPFNRLLVETDGLGAIEWALGTPAPTKEYLMLLEDHFHQISKIREVSQEKLEKQVQTNLFEFLRIRTCL